MDRGGGVVAGGVLAAAEYAMMALIEAPVALKVATVLCAIAALVGLESDRWLRRRGRYAFAGYMAIIAVVYLYFVVHAMDHATDVARIKAGLRELYASSAALSERDIPINSDNATLDQDAVAGWINDFKAWEHTTADKMEIYLGPVARARFLTWGTTLPPNWGAKYDWNYSIFRWQFESERKNLRELVENRVYDD
jgi:hypothetical protein